MIDQPNQPRGSIDPSNQRWICTLDPDSCIARFGNQNPHHSSMRQWGSRTKLGDRHTVNRSRGQNWLTSTMLFPSARRQTHIARPESIFSSCRVKARQGWCRRAWMETRCVVCIVFYNATGKLVTDGTWIYSPSERTTCCQCCLSSIMTMHADNRLIMVVILAGTFDGRPLPTNWDERSLPQIHTGDSNDPTCPACLAA